MSIEGAEEGSEPAAEQSAALLCSRWLSCSEADYTAFCAGSEQGDSGDWELLVALTGIEDSESNLRAKIVLEFLFQNMVFCRDNSMDFAQAALYMKVVSSIYEQSCVLEPHSNQEGAIASFQRHMNDLAGEMRPIASCTASNSDDADKNMASSSSSSTIQQGRLYSIEMMKSMATFFSRTFLRYWAAYKFVHCTLPEFKIVHTVETIEAAPSDIGAQERAQHSHVESV